MKTKILVATSLAVILASGLYASNNGMKGSSIDFGKNMTKKYHNKRMTNHGHKKGKALNGMLEKMNLSDKQKEEIAKIKEQMRAEHKEHKKGGDKGQKRKHKEEFRAKFDEKVYNILNDEQKKQFKVLQEARAAKRAAKMKEKRNKN